MGGNKNIFEGGKLNKMAGGIDIFVGCYGASEFKKKFYISDSLILDTISFFYLISSKFEWNAFNDLKETLIGGTIGYNYGKEFQEAEKAKIIMVYRVTNNSQNFRKLLFKRIVAFPMSTLPGYVMLYKNFKQKDINQITNHTKPVHSTHIYLLLSKTHKKNKSRITVFNRSLKKLKDSGKYDQYFDKTLEFFRETYVK
ncbi:amino acid ABC transporter substrate-binding protein [Candidatus Magnetomorum sp. HK-1]|nr:amino acid ABC transporter substrate-binding protein [Candidatus Magnetomorum sp. HK-1]